jgi:photosystem II stability/assembly factor-like uncharacterized protein
MEARLEDRVLHPSGSGQRSGERGPRNAVRAACLWIAAHLFFLGWPGAAVAQPRWSPIGPYGGYFDTIVANGEFLFTGFAAFSVGYRSTNHGESWQRMPFPVTAVRPDPHNPNNIMAAGQSVYRSTNGGASWRLAAFMPFDKGFAAALRFHVSDSNIAYASVDTDFYRTTDGGGTWERVNRTPQRIVDFQVHPRKGSVVLFLFQGPDTSSKAQLSISYDGGRTIQPVATLPVQWVRTLQIDPVKPLTLFVSSDGNVLRSTDGGLSWVKTCACHNQAVVQDQQHPNTLYAVGSKLRRSTDRGTHWKTLAVPEFANAIAIDPHDSNMLFLATDNGVFRSVDRGEHWRADNKGLRELSVTGFVAVGNNADDIIALSQNPQRTTDGGRHWRNVRTLLGAWRIQAHPRTAGLLFAYGFDGLRISHDAGSTWTIRWPPGYHIALDPRNDRVLYSEIDMTYSVDGIARSTDQGDSWTAVNNGLTDQKVETIAVSPWNSRILLAGTGFRIFRSNDAGGLWREVSVDACCDAESIRFDYRHPGVVWAVFSLGLHRSTDNGITWSRVYALAPNQPERLRFVEFDYNRPNRIYAGGTGLIFSDDGGATWRSFTATGLPSGGRNQLLSLTDRLLLATEHGLYRLLLH